MSAPGLAKADEFLAAARRGMERELWSAAAACAIKAGLCAQDLMPGGGSGVVGAAARRLVEQRDAVVYSADATLPSQARAILADAEIVVAAAHAGP